MTSFPANVPGPDQPAPGRCKRAGFTLIEILLVVALLGLGAGLLVSGASDLLRTREPRPEEIFWRAVTSARQLALESDQTVTFRYDKDKHVLGWGTTPGTQHTLPFLGQLLEFLPVTEQGTVLIGGQLTETSRIKLVHFYSDGACDAFRAQLVDAKGRRTVLSVDPWTCAPMLTAGP